MEKTICVLGATGTIGIEITAQLLESNAKLIAVVRNEKKLRKMLEERGLGSKLSSLKIIIADLFSESISRNMQLTDAIKKSDYVFNCASPKISWVPFSKANRKWGEPVSTLTKEIVKLGKESGSNPHIITFCGPEYFRKYDGATGLLDGIFSKILKSLIGALRDNSFEANFLLYSDYPKWTVFRCGSICEWTGLKGDHKKIGFDFHKDKSDYRQGKGKPLIVEDFVSFLIEQIKSEKIKSLIKEMSFVYNVEF